MSHLLCPYLGEANEIQEAPSDRTIVVNPQKKDYATFGLSIAALALDPKEKILVASLLDGTIRQWEMETCELKDVIRIQKPENSFPIYVPALGFSPDGQWLAAGSIDWAIRIWGFPNQTTREKFKFIAHKGHVRVLTFSPNGRFLASGGGDGKIRLWESKKGFKEASSLSVSDAFVFALTFSPDSQYLLYGNYTNKEDSISLWNISTHTEVIRFKTPDRVRGVAFSPNGRFIAAAIELLEAPSYSVMAWDVKSKNSLFTHKTNIGGATSVSFSPDGKILASGGKDGIIRIWSIPDGELLQTFQVEDRLVTVVINGIERQDWIVGGGAITSLVFSHDSKNLISAGFGQNPRQWDLASGNLLKWFQKSGCTP
jgi:WD40 repeat protein